MSSATHRWKIISVLILVVVVVASVSSYLISYRPLPVPNVVTPISVETTVSSVQRTTSTNSIATANTTLVPIQWITVGQVKSVSYYLSLLESNGTQPYVQLAAELRKLPDFRNASALAKITYLALNATNPEVKEAFQLMLQGGTPDPRDFQYPVPQYNTELQVLYWLALQNEFKKDDTLALAIAMVNGLWVTMGDDEVVQAVRKDTSDLLTFFGETNQIQQEKGFSQLERYPLEAKIAMAWTGGLSMHWIGPLTQPKIPMRLVYYQSQRLPFIVYEKDTVSVSTLRQMRKIAEGNGWWSGDVNADVASVEEYFYISSRSPHWQYVTSPDLVLSEDGLDASTNVNWQFQRYLNGSSPVGDCGTETVFVNALAKSIGIASVPHWMYELGQKADSPSWRSHSYTIYFDPARNLWTAYWKQIITLGPTGTANDTWLVRYFIFRPPIDQREYLQYQINWSDNVPDYYYAKLAFYFKEIPYGQTVSMMNKGIDASQMKQWSLYN